MSEYKNGEVLRTKDDHNYIVTYIGLRPGSEKEFIAADMYGDYYAYYLKNFERIPTKKKMWIGISDMNIPTNLYDTREEVEQKIADWEWEDCSQIIQIEIEDRGYE